MYGELVITCVTSEGCECDGVTFSADRSDHLALFRRHVSRNAAGRGRALLDGLELDVGRIAMCFNTHSYNEEEAVQQGLTYWIEGAGVQPPTWTVLLDAMNYAGLARRHVDNLQADLGVTEGLLSMYSCIMCTWCVMCV